MAQDTFVYWKDRKPKPSELETVLEDYVRGMGKVSWSKETKRFFVNFEGHVSWPFARLLPEEAKALAQKQEVHMRWFEVYIASDHIDVITRMQDEIVNNIARGFAVLCARYWEGEIEE